MIELLKIMLAGGGGLEIIQCFNCGYMENIAFDAYEMQKMYMDKNYYQTKNFTLRLSSHILEIKNSIMTHAKKSDVFLEIAPGRGDLVLALAEEVKFIYTIDPSQSSSNIKQMKNNIKYIQGFFDKDFLDQHIKEKIDCVIFRHLLEHIYEPAKFLKDVVDYLDEDGMIYLEVPNAENIFRYRRFIDIYHDHCGYYQKASIVKVMYEMGCELIDEVEYFNGQHLGLFFRKTKNPLRELELVVINNGIKKSFENEIRRLNDICKKYNRIGIYGAGVQAHTLINHLSYDNLLKINYAFEINEDKIGKYMLNSDILISYPKQEILRDLDCLIMAIPSHEEYAYENELLPLIKKFQFQGDIIKTAKGIECLIF
ncbi:class I SAM-dependent methyltransferase [Campylobacter insulaenigrae]|uniref:class I SAM-dependent methyltransferase n=1 Tax=Campylobacter insulaenigrae TaxID=260714 RepID=UPI00242BA887|nr:class I SAM-dependent methyltransferase [Campylobacter insulaenigrae]